MNMWWMILLIPGGLITVSLYFDKKRKKRTTNKQTGDKSIENLYNDHSAASKSADPKNVKNF